MRRLSLTVRLAVLLATFSFVALALLGGALYVALGQQLALRDDGALLTRVEQIRTLLRDMDARALVRDKPQLFANMLGNTESLLVIRPVAGAPLLEVNPGRREVPQVTPLPAGEALGLDAVQRSTTADGTPFIYTAVLSEPPGGGAALEILSGRLLTERTRILREYRDNIILFSSVMAVLAAALAYLLARRGMSPLRRLARQTATIGVGTLSQRLQRDDAPAELDALIEQFNAMLARLERGFEQLKQVSADMAHDLRTPINNLLGQTEVGLGQVREPHYYQRLLGSHFEELQRLSRMIDNMLFLARAEHADHPIDRTGLELAQELGRLCDYFEDLACERDVRLAWHGEGSVWADAALLRRALANLLANAVRFAEPGSVIEVTAGEQGDEVLIRVRNRGQAIAPEHLESVFERFYRVDASRQHSSQSSGLGLSIVRSIMQLHQGRCWADSSEGATCFTLAFPRVSHDRPPSP
ncbi:heavy metal sensor histidine kinase [Pseudomonas sp. MNR3A]|uniref:heavy metal sensor histidine kinase n=1 Tax=Pseudomonas sp. MNR3A TaxID=2615213 RepID=UPI00129BE316|nr:heavy metal sensor histidine kinase [Pseudomonas sp. MNR3A]